MTQAAPATLSGASPLTGIRVLDISTGMSGAVATMLMRDFGADVTVAEPRGGHPLAGESGWVTWGRGKTRLRADLGAAAGRARIQALSAEVDVLVDDLPPGELEQRGLAPETLRAANPRLVHLSITACGPAGDWADLPADEALVCALSGAMRRQPGFREGPVYFVLPFCSYSAAMLALHGVGAALARRESSGAGGRVETSLLAGALASSAGTFATPDIPFPAIPIMRQPLGAMPLYRLYQAQDGRWLHVGGLTARFWPRAAVAVGRPELISDPRFELMPRLPTTELRKQLIAILAAEFDRRPFHEWDRILEENDLPYSPSLTVDEFRDDPQLRFQELVVSTKDKKLGPVEWLGKVIRFNQGNPGGAAKPVGAGEGVLSGIRVVDASGYIAGAYGGAFLADLGADVIKVEPPEGDGLRTPGAGFLNWNRGKRGVCLDLRTEGGRDAFLRLAARADVVLENMRPGVAGRLGAGYEAIKQQNPAVVYCYVSAFGSEGPYRHKPGFDPIMQARSGIERAQGGLENPPVFLMPPVTDNTAAMLNATAIVLALFHRARTGEGQFVETSLMHAAAFLQSDGLAKYEGSPPRPVNDREHLGPHALRRLYRCKDGWLMLACRDDRDFGRLCAALGPRSLAAEERFATAEARVMNDGDLALVLSERFATLPLARAIANLRRRGVPVAPADGRCDDVNDPQIVAAGYVDTYHRADLGNVRQPAGLTRVDGIAPAARRTGPLLGEHTRAVLAEYGLKESEIDALIASGGATQAG